MKTTHASHKLSRRGQGMTEYILVVALIAIACIGVVTRFGDNIRVLYGMAADAVAGADSVQNPNKAGAATDKALTSRTLKTFAQTSAY